MRIIITLAISFAIACNPSCGGTVGQTATQQAPAAIACVPGAVGRIETVCLAQSGTPRTLCIVTEVLALIVCWSQHQPPPAPAPSLDSPPLP